MLGWLLLALPLALLLLALLPPVDIRVEASVDEHGPRQRASIAWLGLRRDLQASHSARRAPPRPRRRMDAIAMLRTKGAIEAVQRLARRLWRSVKLRMLHLHARIGLSDPAETGMAIGAFAPLFVLMPLTSRTSIRIEPDYERERIGLRLEARARVWPLLAAAALVAFLCTPATWRAARAGRRA